MALHRGWRIGEGLSTGTMMVGLWVADCRSFYTYALHAFHWYCSYRFHTIRDTSALVADCLMIQVLALHHARGAYGSALLGGVLMALPFRRQRLLVTTAAFSLSVTFVSLPLFSTECSAYLLAYTMFGIGVVLKRLRWDLGNSMVCIVFHLFLARAMAKAYEAQTLPLCIHLWKAAASTKVVYTLVEHSRRAG